MIYDLYSILELSPQCSQNDIKTSYRRLALKWHPDKNQSNIIQATEKFRQIQLAYNTLSQTHSRYVYDNMSSHQKIELFQTIKTIIVKYPTLTSLYQTFIDTFYEGDDSSLQNNINNFDFTPIYHNLIHKIKSINNISNDFDSYSYSDLDLIVVINAYIIDIYNDKYAKITIPRTNKHPFEGYVSLSETQIIFNGEGNDNNNLIIKIIPQIDDTYKIINNILYVYLFIDEYLYLNGGKYSYHHINDCIIEIDLPSFQNNIPIYIIPAHGLLIHDDHDRSDLVLYFNINKIK